MDMGELCSEIPNSWYSEKEEKQYWKWIWAGFLLTCRGWVASRSIRKSLHVQMKISIAALKHLCKCIYFNKGILAWKAVTQEGRTFLILRQLAVLSLCETWNPCIKQHSRDTRHLYPQGSAWWGLRIVFGLDHYRGRI